MTKNVEMMAKVLCKCKFDTCEDCMKQSNNTAYRCDFLEKAKVLSEAGYGHVFTALKEFAERLKDFIFQNSSIGCLTIDGEERPHSQVSCTPEAIENYIDEVLKEYDRG